MIAGALWYYPALMTVRPLRLWISASLFALAAAPGLLAQQAGKGAAPSPLSAEIDKLAADLKAAKDQIAADAEKFKAAQNEIEQMTERLKAAGIAHKEEADKLKQALAEYKQRADQLAIIEQRFRDLKARLDKLNQIGLKVVVRNNKAVAF